MSSPRGFFQLLVEITLQWPRSESHGNARSVRRPWKRRLMAFLPFFFVPRPALVILLLWKTTSRRRAMSTKWIAVLTLAVGLSGGYVIARLQPAAPAVQAAP